MANGNGSMTKDEMADVLDSVQDILTDAYDPLTNREDAMAAIGAALDLLEGNAPDGDDGDDDDSDDQN